MLACPTCQTQNQPSAKYCAICGTALTPSIEVGKQSTETKNLRSNHTQTRPLAQDDAFPDRPLGAVFGKRFLATQLIFTHEQEHRYLVEEFGILPAQTIAKCPNPACGALLPPPNTGPELFCQSCGTSFAEGAAPSTPTLILYETVTPHFTSSAALAQYVLPHAAVRSPLAVFEETVAGRTRYCFVAPYVAPLPAQPEQAQVLRWGIELAHGLEFLHQNHLTFAGRITPTCFGYADDKIVWSGFRECYLVPDLDPARDKGDVIALASQLWQWLTGSPKFTRSSSLPSALNEVFEQALTNTQFETGAKLAEALNQAQEQIAAHQSVDYRLGQRTDVGRARTLNEDSLFAVQLHKNQQSLSQPMGIYVIADGMGGHARGEVASGTITNLLSENFGALLTSPATPETGQRWLEEAVGKANHTLYEMRHNSGSDMGSTLVMAVLVGNTACIGHVGDSRAYQINSQGITRLTADHSLVERLVATGQITPAEARHHPQSNVIYRVMGDKPRVEADPSHHLLRPGDHLLLCSDGLSGMVEDSLIHEIVINAVSPQDACDKLVEAANQAGGDDNISVIVIEVVEA